MKIAPLGVPIKFSWSSLILLGVCIMNMGVVGGLVLFSILVFSLLVHEYFHVFTALKNGYKVREVQVLVFGAMALIETGNVPIPPSKELPIAIAGPTGSMLLGILAYILIGFGFDNSVLVLFKNINFMLAIFNMIPLYPTDGGRVLNAIIGLFAKPLKAEKISKYISISLCSVGIVCCVYYAQFWLMFIFVMIILMNINKTPIVNNK